MTIPSINIGQEENPKPYRDQVTPTPWPTSQPQDWTHSTLFTKPSCPLQRHSLHLTSQLQISLGCSLQLQLVTTTSSPAIPQLPAGSTLPILGTQAAPALLKQLDNKPSCKVLRWPVNLPQHHLLHSQPHLQNPPRTSPSHLQLYQSLPLPQVGSTPSTALCTTPQNPHNFL